MTYREMVAKLRTRQQVSPEEINAVLAVEGKTHMDLILSIVAAAGERYHAGDRCDKCREGFLSVRTSKRNGDRVTQYLRCGSCGFKATSIVPADSVRKRRNAKKVVS